MKKTEKAKELVRRELKLGIFPGVLFGFRKYHFKREDVKEKDFVLYLGMFQIILTIVYRR